MPGHRSVLQFQLLLPLLEQIPLRSQILLGPLNRIPLQMNPVPEEFQFGTAFVLLIVSERISQVIGVAVRVLRKLILQILQLLQLSAQILDGRAGSLLRFPRLDVAVYARRGRALQTREEFLPAATRIGVAVR